MPIAFPGTRSKRRAPSLRVTDVLHAIAYVSIFEAVVVLGVILLNWMFGPFGNTVPISGPVSTVAKLAAGLALLLTAVIARDYAIGSRGVRWNGANKVQADHTLGSITWTITTQYALWWYYGYRVTLAVAELRHRFQAWIMVAALVGAVSAALPFPSSVEAWASLKKRLRQESTSRMGDLGRVSIPGRGRRIGPPAADSLARVGGVPPTRAGSPVAAGVGYLVKRRSTPSTPAGPSAAPTESAAASPDAVGAGRSALAGGGNGPAGRIATLMSPGDIGSMTVPTRLVYPAIRTNLSPVGAVATSEIAHYVARAHGGAGLVIVPDRISAWTTGAGDGRDLAPLFAAIRGAGSRSAVQLAHPGPREAVVLNGERVMLVPSRDVASPALDPAAWADTTTDERTALVDAIRRRAAPIREATSVDLQIIVDQFAANARVAKEAGADCVEIGAGGDSLLGAFLSPQLNHRTDVWGASVNGRARLAVAVVRAVRNAIGDLPIIVQMNAVEFPAPGSHDAVSVAQRLVAAGADAIHLTGMVTSPYTRIPFGAAPVDANAYRSAAVLLQRMVSCPVIASGRVSVGTAEELVASGDCEFASMGRALLADPELGIKVRSNRHGEIRPCTNCYRCVERVMLDQPITCDVNPSVGQETVPVGVVPIRQRVVVRGSTRSALELAGKLAAREHLVTVVESGVHLGGDGWVERLVTPMESQYDQWLHLQIVRNGGRVLIGSAASSLPIADVTITTPDPRRSDFAPVASSRRYDLRSFGALLDGGGPVTGPVLRRVVVGLVNRLWRARSLSALRSRTTRYTPLGGRVAVLGNDAVALRLAGFLARRDRHVTLLAPGPHVAADLALPRRWSELATARSRGVTILRNAPADQCHPGRNVYVVDGIEVELIVDDVIDTRPPVRANEPSTVVDPITVGLPELLGSA